MSTEWLRASMEVKKVDSLQRIISGYAAVIGNIDLGNDIIEPGAFTKTLAKKSPSDIDVFIGHDMSRLPVGIPVVLRVDGKGLYSETLVKPGPVGDDLLLTAKFMADHGRPLGQSIGYRVAPGGARMDRVNGKTVRRLVEIDLHEYSFASGKAVMNPEALTTGVKTGDGMDYTVKEMDGRWHVMKGGKSLADFASEDDARAKCDALNGGGKTVHPNQLPDSAFLYVAPGGVLDDEGKTVPRSLRHFRYRDADGQIDADALRTALPQIAESKTVGLDADDLARIKARGRRLLDALDRGVKVADEPSEWKTGAPIDLLGAAYGLIDLAERVASEQRHRAALGEDTKSGWRMAPAAMDELKSAHAALGRLVEHAALVAEGKDEEALAAWWQAQFDLLEVVS